MALGCVPIVGCRDKGIFATKAWQGFGKPDRIPRRHGCAASVVSDKGIHLAHREKGAAESEASFAVDFPAVFDALAVPAACCFTRKPPITKRAAKTFAALIKRLRHN